MINAQSPTVKKKDNLGKKLEYHSLCRKHCHLPFRQGPSFGSLALGTELERDSSRSHPKAWPWCTKSSVPLIGSSFFFKDPLCELSCLNCSQLTTLSRSGTSERGRAAVPGHTLRFTLGVASSRQHSLTSSACLWAPMMSSTHPPQAQQPSTFLCSCPRACSHHCWDVRVH